MSIESDLIDAIAKVEHDLWIHYDCCRKRRIVLDAILPVIARLLPSAPQPIDKITSPPDLEWQMRLRAEAERRRAEPRRRAQVGDRVRVLLDRPDCSDWLSGEEFVVAGIEEDMCGHDHIWKIHDGRTDGGRFIWSRDAYAIITYEPNVGDVFLWDGGDRSEFMVLRVDLQKKPGHPYIHTLRLTTEAAGSHASFAETKLMRFCRRATTEEMNLARGKYMCEHRGCGVTATARRPAGWYCSLHLHSHPSS